MEEFLKSETIIIELLILITIVAIIAQKFRMPYTVILVLAGLFVTFQTPLNLEITPELVLCLFIPPLVFEAAFHVELEMLRDNFKNILILAVPGVIITTLIISTIVSFGTGMSFTVAAIFGALISATDPVAVVSLFRTLGISKRLGVTVEGESLFNDGTAIVLFKLTIIIALSGTFNVTSHIFEFVKVSLMGLLIGGVLGWLGSQIIARVDDYLIEVTITTVLAYGSYLLAEHFHVSGVLAVVSAGILSGNLGPKGMSPTTKIVLYNFWEYIAFLANSLVFLFIGLKVNVPIIVKHIYPIFIAVIAVLLSRGIVVYLLTWVGQKITGSSMPLAWKHVLFWGGLRGALSLALALTLPMAIKERELLQTMSYGVVLFTLLGQGTTIHLLLKRLGLTEKPERKIARETKLGKLYAMRAGMERLIKLREEGILSGNIWNAIYEEYKEEDELLIKELSSLLTDHPELEKEIIIYTRREALKAQRSALGEAIHKGMICSEVYNKLIEEVDKKLEALFVIEISSDRKYKEDEPVVNIKTEDGEHRINEGTETVNMVEGEEIQPVCEEKEDQNVNDACLEMETINTDEKQLPSKIRNEDNCSELELDTGEKNREDKSSGDISEYKDDNTKKEELDTGEKNREDKSSGDISEYKDDNTKKEE